MRRLMLCTLLLLLPATAAGPQQCRVLGRLLGQDGRALRGAFVKPYGPRVAGVLAATSPDGTFSLELPRPGGYFLVLGGVHHKTYFMPLLVERPGTMELTVRLAAADRDPAMDSVRVVGDWNGYESEGAIPMSRRPDGTYTAEVPCDLDTLRYQLLGVQAGDAPICGTHADTFVVIRGHRLLGGQSSSFVSALRADRRPVRIVFDPGRLPEVHGPARFTLAGSQGAAPGILAWHQDIERRGRRFSDAYDAFRRSGAPPESFRWDPAPDVRDLDRELRRERDALVRGYLLLGTVRLALGTLDSARVKQVLDEVWPTSPLWSLEWGGPLGILYSLAGAAKPLENLRRYAREVAGMHPDSSVQAAFLYWLLEDAHQRGKPQETGVYYTRLTGDFPGSDLAVTARKRFNPNRAIAVGRPCPDFGFTSLEDSSRVHRTSELQGRYLLLDFWATWCAPCVAELSHLSRAHQRFKDRGLIILSVSFDGDRKTVNRFRQGKWAMPWLHAFESRGFASLAANSFEIVGIPRAILVDPEGRIVAVDAELRREKLGETLARVLGPSGSSGAPGK